MREGNREGEGENQKVIFNHFHFHQGRESVLKAVRDPSEGECKYCVYDKCCIDPNRKLCADNNIRPEDRLVVRLKSALSVSFF